MQLVGSKRFPAVRKRHWCAGAPCVHSTSRESAVCQILVLGSQKSELSKSLPRSLLDEFTNSIICIVYINIGMSPDEVKLQKQLTGFS